MTGDEMRRGHRRGKEIKKERERNVSTERRMTGEEIGQDEWRGKEGRKRANRK